MNDKPRSGFGREGQALASPAKVPLGVRTAFVLGAGLGKRLRPLTNDWPKPLLPVWGRPMIVHAFERLRAIGVQRFIVNTHHRAERYAEIFPDAQWDGVPIIFRHEPVLLDTGGGIKNIEDLVAGETFLVHNGDVVTDLSLEDVVRAHFSAGNEVTLGVRSDGEPRSIAVDGGGRVRDIHGWLGAGAGLPEFLFTGVYVVGPAFLSRLRAGEVKSVVPVFRDMVREGAALGAAVVDEGYWLDAGTVGAYEALNAAPPPGAKS